LGSLDYWSVQAVTMGKHLVRREKPNGEEAYLST
jgi:hypothetical protein